MRRPARAALGHFTMSPYFFNGHQKWYQERRNVFARPDHLPMPNLRAAESGELGGFSGSGTRGSLSSPLHGSLGGHTLAGSSLGRDDSSAPTSLHYGPFRRDNRLPTGDWPALRPSGPEPLDPGERGIATGRRVVQPLGALSNMESKALMIGGAALAGLFFWRRRKRRRR